MLRTHHCGDLRQGHIGEEVTLSGWVQKTRDLGGMTFVDLRDRYGITQLAFNMDTESDLCLQARKLGREYVIQVRGKVIERSSKNKNIPTGDIEIEVQELNVLNSAKTPPFTIEDQTDGGDDLRMQYRYLDIRRNPVRENLVLRHRLSTETRKYLDSQDFIEVETPYLIKSTPEGARDFIVPSLGVIRFEKNEESVRDLGVVYRPVNESIIDCADSLIKFGLVERPSKGSKYVKTLAKVLLVGGVIGGSVYYAKKTGRI